MKKLIDLSCVAFFGMFFLISCQNTSSLTVRELKCEFQTDPIGIDPSELLLQWKIKGEQRGISQTAYRILVSDDPEKLDKGIGNIWDSEIVKSEESASIRFDASGLESFTSYFWKVRIRDQDGILSDWSEPASWETGLLKKTDWQAKWITRTDEDFLRSVLMRNEFRIKDIPVTKARVYITGLGNYQFYINGKKVGNDLLTPGWTQYSERLEYQVYDIGEFLKPGGNAMGAILGSMWWASDLGWQEGLFQHSKGPLKLLVQVHVDYSDGSEDIFISDESWKWKNSPITSNHLYYGETYDARLEEKGWNETGLDDSAWSHVKYAAYRGRLCGPGAPALRKHMELKAVRITEPVPGEYVLDFGQNMVGWAKIKTACKKGDVIKMRFAELLHPDGTVAQENLGRATATDIVICNGDSIEWEPRFTYHGFRYVQVSGLRDMPGESAVCGQVIHTSEPFVGKFECSNELINKIYSNIVWGQRGNFFAVPTDCPQRDERLGWMADAQIFAPTANYNMNLNRFWAKWMDDISDCQTPGGWVHDFNPSISDNLPAKPGWGDACVIIPWQTYRFFGDTRIISDHYATMKKWVEFMHSESEDKLYTWEYDDPGWHGYGDWLSVEETPSEQFGTIYFYYSSFLLSKMAALINKPADSEKYAALAKAIGEAFQEKYWDTTEMNYPGGTQTANLLPLEFGITPDSLKETVVKNIIEDVISHEVHPTSGFLGVQFILPILSEYGQHELAYRMLTQTTYPGWGYMIEKGATTFWERWDSDKKQITGLDGNSRNHFTFGCVGQWIWSTLVGLQVCDEYPGFKRFIINPKPVEGLDWVKAEYESNYGKITVDWKSGGDTFIMHLTVPPNSEALVRLPSISENDIVREGGIEIAKHELLVKSGKYSFTIDNEIQ